LTFLEETSILDGEQFYNALMKIRRKRVQCEGQARVDTPAGAGGNPARAIWQASADETAAG
jgi:hypothetical protein